ncbi:MAG: DUF4365 domain-containing protein [Leptolyngbyaceae cyanobacterium bins.349]|nr:DUF4365 domain-containing protein [Leptolyngbyaceae cyanobacterium bins.349]
MTENFPFRSSSHVVGDVGQTEVALVFKRWGWTADLIASDYGEDLDCNIFINQQRTAFHFRCQVKSTTKDKKYLRFLKSGEISVSIETDLARFWLASCYYPVFLIVYVEDTREIYWENATQYLSKNLDRISKKTTTIRVHQKNKLTQNQVELEKNIQEFYTQILRLSSPCLVCNIIPVMMPSYKIPRKLFRSINIESIGQKYGLNVKTRGLRSDHLPAWITALRSMDLNLLHCWQVSIDDIDLKKFSDSVIRFLEYLGKESSLFIFDTEWLSFICSPIRLLDKGKDHPHHLGLNQDLTGWSSFCYINQEIQSDFLYAFDLPEGSLKPFPYNGFSWRFNHFVEPERDLAIELLGMIPITPSFIAQKSLFKDYIRSQFLPWICFSHEVDLLRKVLASYALVFAEIPSLCKAETIVGAICSEMFDPTAGWVPEPEDWPELENDSINEKLNQIAATDELPGRHEDLGVTDFVLKFFGNQNKNIKNLIVSENEYIPGLPINHLKRFISIQRLRVLKEFNIDEITQRLSSLKPCIELNLEMQESVEVNSHLFKNLDDTLICVLSVSWMPDLCESSLASIERFSDTICKSFEAAVENSYCGEFKGIEDILKLGAIELEQHQRPSMPRYLFTP